MCLIVPKRRKPRIARRDIELIKIFSKSKEIKSYYQHCSYTLNELYTTNIKEIYSVWNKSSFDGLDKEHLEEKYRRDTAVSPEFYKWLGPGFHSITRERCQRFFDKYKIKKNETNIHICIIPKGSEYYKEDGLFISNQIIVKEKTEL